jgi:nitrate reductase cytochrome c-type subunit
MNKSWSLVAAGAAVLLLLFFLSSSGKTPPVIPANANHAELKTNDSCLACHAPGKQAPLKPAHPPKEQCLTCHKAA